MKEHFKLLLASQQKVKELKKEIKYYDGQIGNYSALLNNLSIKYAKILEDIKTIKKEPQEDLWIDTLRGLVLGLILLTILVVYILATYSKPIGSFLKIMLGIDSFSFIGAIIVKKMVNSYYQRYRYKVLDEVSILQEQLDEITIKRKENLKILWELESKRNSLYQILKKEEEYGEKLNNLLINNYGPLLDKLIEEQIDQDNQEIKEIYDHISLTLEL